MTNDERAAGALHALVTYQQQSPETLGRLLRTEEASELIADLITDLHHLADKCGANWSLTLARASARYAEET